MTEPAELAFHKSTYSDPGGQCVEVAKLPDGNRVVRDSKNPIATMMFTLGEWEAFIGGVKDGEFD